MLTEQQTIPNIFLTENLLFLLNTYQLLSWKPIL